MKVAMNQVGWERLVETLIQMASNIIQAVPYFEEDTLFLRILDEFLKHRKITPHQRWMVFP
jgi:hypothetical protein